MGAYWWSRYGDFSPGEDNYPHMGEVVAYYRVKRGFRRQEDLAVALGCSKRSVEEWEREVTLSSPNERRKVLSRLLRIPPCLLALDWHFMAENNKNSGIVDLYRVQE